MISLTDFAWFPTESRILIISSSAKAVKIAFFNRLAFDYHFALLYPSYLSFHHDQNINKEPVLPDTNYQVMKSLFLAGNIQNINIIDI